MSHFHGTHTTLYYVLQNTVLFIKYGLLIIKKYIWYQIKQKYWRWYGVDVHQKIPVHLKCVDVFLHKYHVHHSVNTSTQTIHLVTTSRQILVKTLSRWKERKKWKIEEDEVFIVWCLYTQCTYMTLLHCIYVTLGESIHLWNGELLLRKHKSLWFNVTM